MWKSCCTLPACRLFKCCSDVVFFFFNNNFIVALMFKMPQQVVDKKLNMLPFYKKSLLMLYMPSVVQVMMTE